MVDKRNPSYYKDRPIEIFDCIASIVFGKNAFEAYLVGNVVKYLSRYDLKNGLEDLDKADKYLQTLIKYVTPKED